MKRERFVYDFDSDEAFIETAKGKVIKIACFRLKFAMKCGQTEITYWPNTIVKRKKALEILDETGSKPHMDDL